MDFLNKKREECLKIPILNILQFYKYPLKGSYPKMSTIALWRGGKNYNVIINIDSNSFYDFVLHEYGNVIKLHELITGENSSYQDIIDLYSNKNNLYKTESFFFNKNINGNDFDKKEIIEEIQSIYKNSKNIFDDFYFEKKGITIDISNKIKQIQISKFILNQYKRKINYLSASDFHIINLNNSLVIPIYNIHTKQIQSLQYILKDKNNEINKYFHKNAVFKYGVFPVNLEKLEDVEDHKEVLLCEGVATGMSILNICRFLKIDIPIICCFNSGNINNVAQYFIEQNKKIIIATDFDKLNVYLRHGFQNVDLGTGSRTIKEYNFNKNVLCTIPTLTEHENTKFYLKEIDSIELTEKDNEAINFSDFNDIEQEFGLETAANIFIKNLEYYCQIFAKTNFLQKSNTKSTIEKGNSPFSYNDLSKLSILNDIILENNFIFYNN